MAIHQAVFII